MQPDSDEQQKEHHSKQQTKNTKEESGEGESSLEKKESSEKVKIKKRNEVIQKAPQKEPVKSDNTYFQSLDHFTQSNHSQMSADPFRGEHIEDDSSSLYVQKTSNQDYHGTEKAKECTSEHSVARLSKGGTQSLTSRSHGFLGAGKISSGKSTVKVTKCKHARTLSGGSYDEVETCGYCCIHTGVTFGCTAKNTSKVGSSNFAPTSDETDKALVNNYQGDLVLVPSEASDLEQNNIPYDNHSDADHDSLKASPTVIVNDTSLTLCFPSD